MTSRYAAPSLILYARNLLTAAGLEEAKAEVVARVLVEGDLLGHTTHGLALLASYLSALEEGTMARSGEPVVVADAPAALTWDGCRLPGPWLVTQALETAIERARTLGTCTVVIRRSHHIACLAAYLQSVTEQGFMALLSCSDPSSATVAAHGGRDGVFTPNPYAAAWPTTERPVIFDVSMSITTNGLVKRVSTEGGLLPGPWLIDTAGMPTNDARVMSANPPGALLPMGGLDHGHKGYALALLVEALTGGLGGYGRADPSEGWSASVFVQVLNPALFGGEAAFARETGYVARACRTSRPRTGIEAVRLPGDAGLRRRADQLEQGIDLHPSILPALAPWVKRFGLHGPSPVA